MRASVILLCLFCAGCVLNTDYPSDWPRQIVTPANEGCPDVAGVFRDPGRWASEDNEFSLAEYLFDLEETSGTFSISHEGSDTFVISSPSSEAGGEHRVEFSRSSGDYDCDDGQHLISRAQWLEPNAGIGVVAAKYRERIGFSRTEDGSLLADYHGSGGGVMLLLGVIPVPSAAKGNDYALWRPVESD